MKEIILILLAFQTPLWTHLFTFSTAWCLGGFTVGIRKGLIKPLEALMYVIILFYALAIGRSAITSSPYPPIELTGLVGALAGSMNEKLGEYFRKKINDK